MFERLKDKRRERLKAMPTPEAWRTLLDREMAVYKCLSPDDRAELEGHTKVLLAEKSFVGANGLVVTDEMRVLICAQAAMLLLHRTAHYFPNVDTVVIYEDAFVSNIREDMGGAYLSKPQARIGESNAKTGVVVLAWATVRTEAANPKCGRNVVLHEFAHQLDSENGYVDGAPALSSSSAYRAWSRVMSHEFEHLRKDVEHHHKTFIDEYGATSPAEFFAVITEAFFEKPCGLKRRHPELYDLLADFYQQNPAKLSEQMRTS